MSDAVRDDNNQAAALGVSTVDGVTPTPFEVNPVTDNLAIEPITNAGRVITIGTRITRDENNVPVMCAARSDNGQPIPVHVTPEGRLLIEIS